jgi:hypothetical protein
MTQCCLTRRGIVRILRQEAHQYFVRDKSYTDSPGVQIGAREIAVDYISVKISVCLSSGTESCVLSFCPLVQEKT